MFSYLFTTPMGWEILKDNKIHNVFMVTDTHCKAVTRISYYSIPSAIPPIQLVFLIINYDIFLQKLQMLNKKFHLAWYNGYNTWVSFFYGDVALVRQYCAVLCTFFAKNMIFFKFQRERMSDFPVRLLVRVQKTLTKYAPILTKLV